LKKKPSSRTTKEELKNARKHKPSSQRWLRRQLSDPYVQEAQRKGYRSRAAFKLLELNEKYKFLSPGKIVVDLGAAPGGWTQVTIEKVQAPKNGKVFALDLLEMEDLPGAVLMQGDFYEDDTYNELILALKGKRADVVLSDMAPSTMGHRQTDHIRIMGLAEAAYDFAHEILGPEGVFVSKVFQGGAEQTLLTRLKKDFKKVAHAKPPSSRKESSEMYVVAMGFRMAKSE
jgi:23S rRNA (uridine2552-2'-O)-methyltransferase